MLIALRAFRSTVEPGARDIQRAVDRRPQIAGTLPYLAFSDQCSRGRREGPGADPGQRLRA